MVANKAACLETLNTQRGTMAAHQHIADLYFYEEISKALGSQCKFEWVRNPRRKDLALRTSSSTMTSSRSPSPQASKHSGLQSRAPSPNSYPIADNSTSSACSQCIPGRGECVEDVVQSYAESAIFDNPSCLKKIGLLYTDAAHSVLNDEEVAKFVNRRGSLCGPNVL